MPFIPWGCRRRYNTPCRTDMKANFDLDAQGKTFATGLLAELVAVLRRSRPGDLVAITAREASLGAELEAWCRITGNALVDHSERAGRSRWVVRCGTAPDDGEIPRPV